jgi:hypothetical protein
MCNFHLVPTRSQQTGERLTTYLPTQVMERYTDRLPIAISCSLFSLLSPCLYWSVVSILTFLLARPVTWRLAQNVHPVNDFPLEYVPLTPDVRCPGDGGGYVPFRKQGQKIVDKENRQVVLPLLIGERLFVIITFLYKGLRKLRLCEEVAGRRK